MEKTTIILGIDRLSFLELSRDRKLEILKSHIKKADGISVSRLNLQLDKFIEFLKISLARDYTSGDVKIFESELFPELKTNHLNRKSLIYRNRPNISGRW